MDNRLYDVLSTLKDGYMTGNFEALFPYLDEDCVFESQWVFTPLTGYKAVTEYFTRKGHTLIQSSAFPECSIAEMIDWSAQTIEDAKKLCLEMKQTINHQENAVLVIVTLNQSGMVERIDLCAPELYKYRILADS